jgi:hypothetical protein
MPIGVLEITGALRKSRKVKYEKCILTSDLS